MPPEEKNHRYCVTHTTAYGQTQMAFETLEHAMTYAGTELSRFAESYATRDPGRLRKFGVIVYERDEVFGMRVIARLRLTADRSVF